MYGRQYFHLIYDNGFWFSYIVANNLMMRIIYYSRKTERNIISTRSFSANIKNSNFFDD